MKLLSEGEKEEKIQCLTYGCYEIGAFKILSLCENYYNWKSWATILAVVILTEGQAGKMAGQTESKVVVTVTFFWGNISL